MRIALRRAAAWAVLPATVLLGLAGHVCADVTLVADGKSDYVIVVSKDPSPSEKFAAEELASHLKLMSGAELPVRGEDGAVPDKAIVLGFGPAAESLGVKADDALGTDGFIIRTVGQRLVIAGGRQRGTMYGVYTLLERLGCRWWTPSESTIPRMATVKTEPLDLREIPALEYRDMLYSEREAKGFQLWCARNKLNGMAWKDADEKLGGRYVFCPDGLAHSYSAILKASGLEIKPEMMALSDPKSGKWSGQVCHTNPETTQALVQGVINLLRKSPQAKFAVLSQMDDSNYCRCEKCAALAKQERSMSGPYVAQCNAVAEAVEKQIPGARILITAYSWTQEPPKMIRPRDNVIVEVAPVGLDFAHSIATGEYEANRKWAGQIEGWSRMSSKMLVWFYSGNRGHYLMPNPDLDGLVANLKFLADHKAKGIFLQGTHNGRAAEFVPLRMWLAARMLWNPQADGQALIGEFVKGYYGPAAEPIQKYIDLIHEPGRKEQFAIRRRSQMHLPFVKPEIMAESEALMRQAEKAAEGNADLSRRVRHAHMPIWYMLMKRGPDSSTWKTVEGKVGKLDLAAVAGSLKAVIKEWGVNTVADYEPVAPFVAWLDDYPRIVKEKGRAIPPELEKADPATYRLIQARQIDSGMIESAWWQRMDDASDNWALECPTSKWYIQHTFSPYDEFKPGAKYRFFVRVKGSSAAKDGPAFVVGLAGKPHEFPASALADGKFHVFEVATITAPEDLSMYFILPSGVKAKVYLDCLWLEEVK